MKCVVVGDIGWEHLYHLGDEAMTEAALSLLEARGVDEITLVAGQPEVSESFYNRPAVKRFAFGSKWDRNRLEAKLAKVTRQFDSAESPLHEAVRDADAVVIAGGGNMNSDHVHLLYERVAIARLARHTSTPLFVTSQTVGPMLRKRDQELVSEIIEIAECFGARELTTYRLALELGGDPERVIHTMDDAMMLKAHEEDFQWVDQLDLSERFVAASFTSHPGSTGLGAEEYRAQLAETLDELARRLDADVALAPHAGSLVQGHTKRDQILNEEVVAETKSGRVKALPMLTARQDVALISRSILSLSTRYHPTVFGPGLGTPTASISLSYYSSIRMRGSLRNVGMEHYVVPATSWTEIIPACEELIERTPDVRDHLSVVSEQRFGEQSAWWDAIVEAMSSRKWNRPSSLTDAKQFVATGSWSERVEAATPVFDLFGQEKIWTKWKHQDFVYERDRASSLDEQLDEERSKTKDLTSRLRAADKQARESNDRAQAAESRKAVRAADALGRALGKFSKR